MAAEVKKEIQLEIAHVLFTDIVGYSKLSINEQHTAVEELNQIVRASAQFQKAEADSRLLKIPAGDGMALVFYTTPEAPDRDGKPYTVRYEAVNAMLLNEFLKEHCKVEKLEATVAQQQKAFESKVALQQKQIEALTAGLQKVNAQLEASKPAPQVVNNP